MNFPGPSASSTSLAGIPGGGMMGGMDPQALQEQQMIKTMHAVMESCAGKTVMSGVMGFGLGGAFGLFMSSTRYDTTYSSATVPGTTQAISDLPVRQQLRHGLKDMGKQTFSSAKNFGKIGAIFSGVECSIEGLRAKNDIWNGVAGGCITGGALAMQAGPQAAAFGCAGFAVFSAAIDYYMRMPEDERRYPVD